MFGGFANIPQYFPLLSWWRQGRTKLSPPTDSFEHKTVIITGGSGAVCSAAAARMIDLGASTVILAVPDIPEEEGEKKRVKLEKLFGVERLAKSRVLVWALDLLSFERTAVFGARAERELERLDVVVMGAGAIFPDRKFSTDGWERTLQITHLSCALLTVLLLPVLQRSAEKHKTRGVLATISSMGALVAGATFPTSPAPGKTNFQTLSVGTGRMYEFDLLYPEAKLTHLFWLHELSRRLSDAEASGSTDPTVAVHAVDFCVTDAGVGLTVGHGGSIVFSKLFGRPAETCAMPVVYASVPRVGTHGKWFVDYDARPYPKFLDSDWGKLTQRRIWEETERVLSEVSAETKKAFARLERSQQP